MPITLSLLRARRLHAGCLRRRSVAFSWPMALWLLLACQPFSATGAPPATRPPNVVLLVADDLGWNDLGCYGRTDQRTPQLDALAAQGVRFTAATSAGSVCSPSRAAMLTGQHPARLNLTTFLPGRPPAHADRLLSPTINQHLPEGVATLADQLKSLGYRSVFLGKWHLGGAGQGPLTRGFDAAIAGSANPGQESPEGGKGELGNAQAAVDFIDAHQASHAAEPFLLTIGFNSPHIPLAAPQRLIDANSTSFNPLYAAVVEGLDTAVGKILAALDRHGLADTTLVVFTSDNGGLHVPEGSPLPATHNTPFRAGKGFLYEGGLRVPLIVRLPGRSTPGRTVDSPVSTGDILPTICHLSGAAQPAPCDFLSFLPLLSVEEAAERPERPLFWHQPHATNQGGRPAGAIRVGDWKLIEHYEDGRLELFNLAIDPGEQADRRADEPSRVAALRGRLEAWRRDVGARGMKANGQFSPQAWRACYVDTDVSTLRAAPTAIEMAPGLEAWRSAMQAAASEGPRSGDHFFVLEARDAQVEGRKLQYETPPEKDTLGFWVDASDSAHWDLSVTTAGRYRVGVLQGCGSGNGGSTVEISAGASALTFIVEATGHFQAFVPRNVGEIDLQTGPNQIRVRAVHKQGGAVMDLRRVSLERIE